jgi:hypothetical protein
MNTSGGLVHNVKELVKVHVLPAVTPGGKTESFTSSDLSMDVLAFVLTFLILMLLIWIMKSIWNTDLVAVFPGVKPVTGYFQMLGIFILFKLLL